MTFGERVAAQIVSSGAAELLDRAIGRLASSLDVTDTDEGLEAVATELHDVILTAITGCAVRRGWQIEG